MCTKFIFRHIEKLARTQIFTTRDMLVYGTRAAVDSALSRMVEKSFITRLAWGVFVKDASKEPTILEIANAKTNGFAIKIAALPDSILNELGLSSKNSSASFAKRGHSSSFLTIHGRVHLKGIAERKMRLLESAVGKIAYALWSLNYGGCTVFDVNNVTRQFGRTERELFWLLSSLMPAWLTSLSSHRFPRRHMTI
jgi:Family of unknown function (DUF6088)